MAEHKTRIHQIRVGRAVRYSATCSCGRWETPPYALRTKAENLADFHELKGDEQNRARAQFERGAGGLGAALKWYEQQAANPLNTERDREQWSQLAEEIRARLGSAPTEGQETLW